MSEEKGFITQLGEFLDTYRRGRRLAASETRPARSLARFLRWLVPNGGTILVVLALVLTQQVWARPAQQQLNAPGPSATTVNYQGRLADPAGNPLDGTYGMSFALFAADTGGSPVWGPENHPAVPVGGGLFSVGLGSQTSGGIPTTTWNGDRYLEITVDGETLSPRELIRSVPIAGMALTVPDGAIGTAQVADGAITSRQLAPSWYEDRNTSPIETTSTSPVPTGVSLEFTCETNCTALVMHRGLVAHTVQDGRVDVGLWVDDQRTFRELADPNAAYTQSCATCWHQLSSFGFVNLSPGIHTVDVRFNCFPATPGTCYYYGEASQDWEHLYVLVFAQP